MLKRAESRNRRLFLLALSKLKRTPLTAHGLSKQEMLGACQILNLCYLLTLLFSIFCNYLSTETCMCCINHFEILHRKMLKLDLVNSYVLLLYTIAFTKWLWRLERALFT